MSPSEQNYAQLPQISFRGDIFLSSKGDSCRGLVLMFHGLTATPAECEGLAGKLHQGGYSVYAPLLRGHGRKAEELAGISAETWMHDARTALKKLREEHEGVADVHLFGMSFGGLLALLLAAEEEPNIKSVIALSLPFSFRRWENRTILPLLSRMPEAFLCALGTRRKQLRPKNYLAFEHNAFPEHSIGAIARLDQLRRRLIRRAPALRVRALLLQDPFDHHLTSCSAEEFQELVPSRAVKVDYVPYGQHELLLGHQHEYVYQKVMEFMAL